MHQFQSDKNKASLQVIYGCRWYPPPKQLPHVLVTCEAQRCHFAGAGQHFLTLTGVILEHATKKPINMTCPRLHHSSCYSGGRSQGTRQLEVISKWEKTETPPHVLSHKSLQTPVCAPPVLYKISIRSCYTLHNFVTQWNPGGDKENSTFSRLLIISLLFTAAKSYSSWRGLRKPAN